MSTGWIQPERLRQSRPWAAEDTRSPLPQHWLVVQHWANPCPSNKLVSKSGSAGSCSMATASSSSLPLSFSWIRASQGSTNPPAINQGNQQTVNAVQVLSLHWMIPYYFWGENFCLFPSLAKKQLMLHQAPSFSLIVSLTLHCEAAGASENKNIFVKVS